MSVQKQDVEFTNIVKNILNNEEFKKIDKIEHHGISRLDHSMMFNFINFFEFLDRKSVV